MAPRGTAQKSEVGLTQEEIDAIQGHWDKSITAKMQDFHTYMEEALGVKLDPQTLIVGLYTYPYFQRSDFNKRNTAQRRADREAAASNGAPADAGEEPAPAKPARRRGRAAASTSEDTPKAPARRGRGRATKPTTDEEPY